MMKARKLAASFMPLAVTLAGCAEPPPQAEFEKRGDAAFAALKYSKVLELSYDSHAAVGNDGWCGQGLYVLQRVPATKDFYRGSFTLCAGAKNTIQNDIGGTYINPVPLKDFRPK